MQVEAPQVEADLCDIARRLASIPRAQRHLARAAEAEGTNLDPQSRCSG